MKQAELKEMAADNHGQDQERKVTERNLQEYGINISKRICKELTKNSSE